MTLHDLAAWLGEITTHLPLIIGYYLPLRWEDLLRELNREELQ